MYCAKCGHRLGSDARVCPKCGADLTESGALRLTNPGTDIAANLRRFDRRAGVSRPSASDVERLIERVDEAAAFQASDGEEPEALEPAVPELPGDAADLDAGEPGEADGQPTPKHGGRPSIVAQVSESIDRARDWVGDRLPQEFVETLDEVRAATRKRSLASVLVTLVLVALVLSAVLAWLLMSSPDRAIRGVRDDLSASSSATSTVPGGLVLPNSTPALASSGSASPSASSSTVPVTLPAGANTCADGVGANDAISCEFALVVAAKVDRSMSGSVTVSAYSPTSKQTYTLTCTRDAIITCGSSGKGRVYIVPK